MPIYQRILDLTTPEIVKGWDYIRTIDMHTGGEPLRVIIEGLPVLSGKSVLENRRLLRDHHDDLRKALMWEPRGHADMYGCILTPPNDDEGDFGIVFIHNEGYSTMCGHAIIAISTLAVQMNWIDTIEGENILKIDAPCGRITSYINVQDSCVRNVRFHGVPSFVVGLDRSVEVKGLGMVTYDLAYGGAFYAYVDMARHSFDFDLTKKSYRQLISNGMKIKKAVIQNEKDLAHPFEKDLGFLYGTIFLDTDLESMKSSNVCVFADGEVDRCPTGSGVMGRMAIHHMRKEMNLNDKLIVNSIVNSQFTGSIVHETDFGPYKAVIPCVEGTAHITGMHTFIIDPDDPLKEGFLLR